MAEPVLGICFPLGGGHSPVDPGFGRPGGGWSPTDPGYGHGHPGGGHPSGGPVPPPGVWGPPGGNLPAPPPNTIDNSLPAVPGIPVYPWPPPNVPENSLPTVPPGTIYPPLPPDFSGQFLCLVVVYGVGYRWTVIDTNLKPSIPAPAPK